MRIGGTDSFKDRKVDFRNFGLKCRGPTGGIGHMIFDRCPKEVTIDLDTARLLPRRVGNAIKFILDGRCVGCLVHYRLMALLRRDGIEPLREPGAGTPVCTARGCKRLSFHGYDSCVEHLSYLLSQTYRGRPISNIEGLRETFKSAIRREWKLQPRYNIVLSRMEQISQGKRPGADLIILDDEFSPASQQL